MHIQLFSAMKAFQKRNKCVSNHRW